MEINQAWIDQQRKLKEVACCGVYSPEQARSQTAILFTSFPAALDALEASIQREAEKDAAIVRLTAERDAAARDLKWLSNEYKFCVTCKRDNGRGVWDCNDERCDAENHYEWRGLCSSNTDAPTGAESEQNNESES